MRPVFTADQFTPTKWDTAADKAAFANRLVRLIETDFKPTIFTRKFYSRLSMTFGHIANFNREGFYATWFSSTERKVEFLGTLVNPRYGLRGDPTWTYSDVEREIASSVWVHEQRAKYETRLAREIETVERAQLAHLQAKYQEEKA